jgi:hypothetical protein
MTIELAIKQRNDEEERQHDASRHPLSDITNGYQPASMEVDEKKEALKARRRAAYRRKKDESTLNQQNENLSALTISGNIDSQVLALR